MAKQRGGLGSTYKFTTIGIVIFLLVAGLAIGLGVYFGRKNNTPENSGNKCPTSITVANTRVVSPTSATPSIVVEFAITPSEMVYGSVDGKLSYDGIPWITSTADGTYGSISFNLNEKLTPGNHSGTVKLAYTDSSGCKVITTQSVSFSV